MVAIRWLAGLGGLALLVITMSSVIRTLIMPRSVTSAVSGAFTWATVGFWRFFARRSGSYARRDAILAWAAPVTILGLLVLWLLLLFVAYSLILFAVYDLDFNVALREAGSSIFTLGFASTDRAQLTAIDFVAAATGPIVIGLLVGYLPTLYGSFNRREVNVTQLTPRCGEPNWGPELLGRQALQGTMDQLPELWHDWERWAADVSESHSSYPVLIALRSTRPNRNWAVGLLCVLDAAALQVALMPGVPQGSARVLLRQGAECFGTLATALKRIQITSDSDTDGEPKITLTYEEFAAAVARLDDAGLPREVELEVAWRYFVEWRALYERNAYAICDEIDAVPAQWSGPRTPPMPTIASPTLIRMRTVGPSVIGHVPLDQQAPEVDQPVETSPPQETDPADGSERS